MDYFFICLPPLTSSVFGDLTMKKLVIVLFLGIIVLIGLAMVVSFLFSFDVSLPMASSGIAVIPIKGEIVMDGAAFSDQMSAMEIADAIDRAASDPSIGAILLEINSGGGSVVATRQIVEKVSKAKEKKPVVSWVSEVGASGAYYVAAASDHIVADADSITGSIGVISVFPNIEGLLEKLGITVTVLKEGEHKDIGSMFSELSEEDKEIIQNLLSGAFARFKDDIIKFRGDQLERTRFEQVADGRILNGEQALDLGLIDELGTRDGAIEAVKTLAGIENPIFTDYGKSEPTLLELFSSAGYRFGFGFKQGLFQVPVTVQS
ncbi:MAG: signal peptide peptidase SppA [Candidatus Diapherotrites archaeon]|uniref:Signal peptide peptidase SppA n=1 Tax=Candidatus Iainarchaeum sp. TaxID=3101447 RepID=A0A2D6M0I7_9ARCH|nr:signal peptide peptidase SppA [Candidatus Diapherotrites archaeon]|tara:strand:- start:2027 stop:2986 length:960 start_codon:yes stop_codon:yes gene_type:complete